MTSAVETLSNGPFVRKPAHTCPVEDGAPLQRPSQAEEEKRQGIPHAGHVMRAVNSGHLPEEALDGFEENIKQGLLMGKDTVVVSATGLHQRND
jgi:hypothetical protein